MQNTAETINPLELGNAMKIAVGAITAGLFTYYFYTKYTKKSAGAQICPMKKSLNARLGGDEIVAKATKIFYAKVLKDETLKPFFKNVDITKQTKKQTDFNIYAFGGSEKWYGRKLTEVHEYMGVSNANFDKVGEYFSQSLRELGVSEDLIREVEQCNEKYRSVVVTV
ncbi:hypothetical protein ABPG72_010922 [Tetrahymena utriculariae]